LPLPLFEAQARSVRTISGSNVIKFAQACTTLPLESCASTQHPGAVIFRGAGSAHKQVKRSASSISYYQSDRHHPWCHIFSPDASASEAGDFVPLEILAGQGVPGMRSTSI
jgi:hypothetical protein